MFSIAHSDSSGVWKSKISYLLFIPNIMKNAFKDWIVKLPMEQKLIAGMLTHVWHYNTWWVVTLHEAIEIEEKIPKEKSQVLHVPEKNFRIWSLKWKKTYKGSGRKGRIS